MQDEENVCVFHFFNTSPSFLKKFGAIQTKLNKMKIWIILLVSTGCSFFCKASPTQEIKSGSIPWSVARVDLSADKKSVALLLEEFCDIQGIQLAVGEKVKGSVSGEFLDTEAQVLLDAVCESHGLAWFFDGSQIYVDRIQDRLTRHLIVSKVSEGELNSVVASLGFASGPEGLGGSVRGSDRTGVITIAGLPSFVTMGEALVKDLDAREGARLEEEIVSKQYRLVYASASDISVNSGSTTTEIAGVARILQETLGLQAGGVLSTGDVRRRSPGNLTSARDGGLTDVPLSPIVAEAIGEERRGNTTFQSDQGGGGSEGNRSSFEPTITANSRLNAVVVRDVAGRMALYDELIQQLDIPTQVIEIRASIVDVDANNRRAFSSEFLGSHKNGSGDVQRFGFDADRGQFDGNDTQGEIPSFIDGSDLVRGIGGNLSTILTGTNWDLLARVKAMEEKGVAQLVTSPMVLTEENRAATIRFDESLYVRLQGERDVDLTEVTTGTELRVTPTVVEENGERKFMLQIEIRDGSFNDNSVDEIPTVSESAISTRAMIPDSRTLLLGGGFVERQFNNRRQVPIVGDIPIAGKLFGSREREHVRAQRFFFLTPRLVNLNQDTREVEREPLETIPGGNMDLTRLLPLPYVSPTRVEDQARKIDYDLTQPVPLPLDLEVSPEKASRGFQLPKLFNFKGRSRPPETRTGKAG